MGEFEPASLLAETLEYAALPQILEKLKSRFKKAQNPAKRTLIFAPENFFNGAQNEREFMLTQYFKDFLRVHNIQANLLLSSEFF